MASCFNLIISKVIFGILVVSIYTLKSAIRLLFFERYYDIHIKLLNMNECVNLSTKRIKGYKCYLKDWKFSHACTCKKEKFSFHQSLAFIVLSFVKAKYNKIWCNEFIRKLTHVHSFLFYFSLMMSFIPAALLLIYLKGKCIVTLERQSYENVWMAFW